MNRKSLRHIQQFRNSKEFQVFRCPNKSADQASFAVNGVWYCHNAHWINGNREMSFIKDMGLFLQKLSEFEPCRMVSPYRVVPVVLDPVVIVEVHNVNVEALATAENNSYL